MVFRVGLTFRVDKTLPPERAPLHDALEALRAVDIEAPTSEAAEHFADLLRLALEREGS
jgi:hypothetical protein